MGARRRRLFTRPSLPYTGSSPTPPSNIPTRALSPVTLLYIRVNPQLCPFLEGPQNQIPQISHRVLPSQSTCHTKILSPQAFSHVNPFLLCQPSLATPGSSSLLALSRPSPQTTSSLGPSHSRTVSPSTHPLPGSGLARGPRGAGARWGPQWGGRAASMAAVAAERRRPPVPARPARQAPRRGGQAGQAARWVTTAAAAAGGGEERERGSARGTRGKGESRWTGEGRVNPRPAGPAPHSHPPLGTQASRPPPWRPAPVGRAPTGGAGLSLAVRTCHGNNRAIGRCCQERNQSQFRTAVARRRRCSRRSGAQTKGGSGAPLPPPSRPPKTAPSGSAPSKNPTMNSQARPALHLPAVPCSPPSASC